MFVIRNKVLKVHDMNENNKQVFIYTQRSLYAPLDKHFSFFVI
jgi:hypothetical protein